MESGLEDDEPQLSKIMATYGLDIKSAEAPELPEGMDRDPVRRQEDFAETADVFGYVTDKIVPPPERCGLIPERFQLVC